jgi:hypothetical protein
MRKAFWIFLSAMLMTQMAHAGLSVSPSVIEKIVTPGLIYHGTYLVTNASDKAVDVSIEPEDWFKRMDGKSDDLSVKEWFSVNHERIRLEPKQRKAIRFTIKPPQDLNLEKSAQVFFSFQEQEGIRSRLGVVIYIVAKNTWKLNAEALSVMVSNQKTSEGGPMMVASIEMLNKSNVHIRPSGRLDVYQKKEKVLASFDFSKNPAIYPEKQRKLVSFLKGTTLPTGTYQGQLSFQIGHTYGEDLVVEKQFPIVIEAAKS